MQIFDAFDKVAKHFILKGLNDFDVKFLGVYTKLNAINPYNLQDLFEEKQFNVY